MPILRPDPPTVNRDPDAVLWPAGRWTITGLVPDDDSDRWTIVHVEPTGPTADHGTAPDVWAESFHLGFMLALAGEPPVVPSGVPAYQSQAFEAGLAAGSRRREEEIAADHEEIMAA